MLIYLPLLAAVVAEIIRSLVTGTSKALGVETSRFLGSVARWSVWVFAILAALSQLGVAEAFIQTLFTGIIATLTIALGLAFGLGGKEEAAKLLEKIRKEISNKD